MLGLAQVWIAWKGWDGLSLVGPHRLWGFVCGLALGLLGGYLLPAVPGVFFVVLPLSLAVLATLAIGGSLSSRNLLPDRFLHPGKWQLARTSRVAIPHAGYDIPGLLLVPSQAGDLAVCLAHGSGDSKAGFKWRLVAALLQRGITVLTVDLAGHGENTQPQRWPECTTELPAAIDWLRQQPSVRRVALLGISMGGALSVSAAGKTAVDGLVLFETPVTFQYDRSLPWREAWDTLRSPAIDLLADLTVWQIWRRWQAPAGKREISLAELIRRLDVPCRMSRVTCPVLLVYGGRDHIAPPGHGRILLAARPTRCRLLVASQASHLALTQIKLVNDVVVAWLLQALPAG